MADIAPAAPAAPASATALPSTGAGGRTFDPKVVLGVLLFGALAFLATLYFIGSGQTGERETGQAHAASPGFNGYSALVRLLEAQGMEVTVSRSQSAFDRPGLLVLTPPSFTDGEALSELIEERRYTGPTLLVLPKWNAMPVPDTVDVEHEDGWVLGDSISAPGFVAGMAEDLAFDVRTGEIRQRDMQWSGLGLSGKLPYRNRAMVLDETEDGARFIPVVLDPDGDVLAGYLDDGGSYPLLDEAVGLESPARPIDEDDVEYWDDYTANQYNLTIVAEPDLLNNLGLADATRAQAALRLIGAVQEGERMPVVFDVTLNGLGGQQNLLTLAFTPPFLAATICLILAMIVIAWRAFRRFGPPAAASRSIAFGKQRLVANGAGLIERSGRLHILTTRYADMIGQQLAGRMGLKHADRAAIDEALARRRPEAEPYSALAQRLEAANRPTDIVRAALALRRLENSFERTSR